MKITLGEFIKERVGDDVFQEMLKDGDLDTITHDLDQPITRWFRDEGYGTKAVFAGHTLYVDLAVVGGQIHTEDEILELLDGELWGGNWIEVGEDGQQVAHMYKVKLAYGEEYGQYYTLYWTDKKVNGVIQWILESNAGVVATCYEDYKEIEAHQEHDLAKYYPAEEVQKIVTDVRRVQQEIDEHIRGIGWPVEPYEMGGEAQDLAIEWGWFTEEAE